jgi:hypothetical protein
MHLPGVHSGGVAVSDYPDRTAFRRGDRVRFKDCFLAGDEGQVTEDQRIPDSVRVVVKIFGRDVRLDVVERVLEKLE